MLTGTAYLNALIRAESVVLKPENLFHNIFCEFRDRQTHVHIHMRVYCTRSHTHSQQTLIDWSARHLLGHTSTHRLRKNFFFSFVFLLPYFYFYLFICCFRLSVGCRSGCLVLSTMLALIYGNRNVYYFRNITNFIIRNPLIQYIFAMFVISRW